MIKTNKNMTSLLEKVEMTEKIIQINATELTKIMFPTFKEVYNCIVVDMNDEIKEENINFKRILSMFGDKTGYEASCNEIRINNYIDCLDDVTVIQFGKIIMDAWKYKLKSEYPKYKFCIILSINKGYGIIRFHVIREDESQWLTNDLDEYADESIIVQEV